MKFIRTLLATAAVSLVATAMVQAQEKVRISDLNWTGATAIAHVMKAVIERRKVFSSVTAIH